MTLKEGLKDWTDFDGAQYQLAICLGLLERYDAETFIKNKGIFWTNNKLGNKLSEILSFLVDIEYLLFDEEELKYKWNEKMGTEKLPYLELITED